MPAPLPTLQEEDREDLDLEDLPCPLPPCPRFLPVLFVVLTLPPAFCLVPILHPATTPLHSCSYLPPRSVPATTFTSCHLTPFLLIVYVCSSYFCHVGWTERWWLLLPACHLPALFAAHAFVPTHTPACTKIPTPSVPCPIPLPHTACLCRFPCPCPILGFHTSYIPRFPTALLPFYYLPLGGPP